MFRNAVQPRCTGRAGQLRGCAGRVGTPGAGDGRWSASVGQAAAKLPARRHATELLPCAAAGRGRPGQGARRRPTQAVDSGMKPNDFDVWMKGGLEAVEAALDRFVPSGAPAGLGEAMRYGVLDGGKRVRPLLVLA